MTVTTATDESGVEYYYTCTAGGGHDSGWQDNATYEDTGLLADRQYTYTVKARDKSADQAETTASAEFSATTMLPLTSPRPAACMRFRLRFLAFAAAVTLMKTARLTLRICWCWPQSG